MFEFRLTSHNSIVSILNFLILTVVLVMEEKFLQVFCKFEIKKLNLKLPKMAIISMF